MNIHLDTRNLADYERFLKIKRLPRFCFAGRTAHVPDEYLSRIGMGESSESPNAYTPPPWLFDYQRDIARIAIAKRKYAGFIDCGLGKTLIEFEFALHDAASIGPRRCVLIVCPLMVIDQTIAEANRFYGDAFPLHQVHACDLPKWLREGTEQIGITNYEALTEEAAAEVGRLGCLILDESSMLKSHYGKWGQRIISMGRGLPWKLALTGTPAPNDRIEFANHAVFLDQFPTVNSFLARYFVNRGETGERWELKPHALHAFYRSLSHWSIFLTNPATYGWKDNSSTIPPIRTHIHDVPLTPAQQDLVYSSTGTLFASSPGGITSRSVLSQIAKGNNNGEAVATEKPAYIRKLVESWPDESTLIWCKFNAEQETIAAAFPGAASVDGDTPHTERMRMVTDFQAGSQRILISKAKILGFGLNLQVATRQVFSGLQDSYEDFYQCVKRSNRIISTRPLNVHIPITSIERPMIETVLAKAARVQRDAEEQERIFKDAAL